MLLINDILFPPAEVWHLESDRWEFNFYFRLHLCDLEKVTFLRLSIIFISETGIIVLFQEGCCEESWIDYSVEYIASIVFRVYYLTWHTGFLLNGSSCYWHKPAYNTSHLSQSGHLLCWNHIFCATNSLFSILYHFPKQNCLVIVILFKMTMSLHGGSLRLANPNILSPNFKQDTSGKLSANG